MKKYNNIIVFILLAIALLYFNFKSEDSKINDLNPITDPRTNSSTSQKDQIDQDPFIETQNSNNEELESQMDLIAPKLPKELLDQLDSGTLELPEDLQAQLNAPPPPFPEDLIEALQIPPKMVTTDEVNSPPSELRE